MSPTGSRTRKPRRGTRPIGWFTRVLAFLIPGFSIGRWIEYTHEPTADLEAPHDLADPALAPYVHAGVLVRPLETLGYPYVQVYLTSDVETVVTIERVRLTGAGGLASEVREEAPDETVSVDYRTTSGQFGKHLRLMVVPRAELNAMGAEGLHLTVRLRVGEGEARGELAFELTRSVRESSGWLT